MNKWIAIALTHLIKHNRYSSNEISLSSIHLYRAIFASVFDTVAFFAPIYVAMRLRKRLGEIL